jgi:hypothetical protein
VPVHGADKLRKLARDLREAGDKDLQRELRSGIARPVKPFAEAVKQEAGAVMPHRGGYAGILARALKVAASTRTTGSGAGIRIVVSAKGKVEERDVAALDVGELRHPIFGRRRHWATTSVRPGFVTQPAERLIDGVRREIENAVDRVADKLERG